MSGRSLWGWRLQVGSGDFSPRDRDRIYGSPRPRTLSCGAHRQQSEKAPITSFAWRPPHRLGRRAQGLRSSGKVGSRPRSPRVEVIRREVLAKHRRALVIYGGGHLFRASQSLVRRLEGHRESTRLHDCDRNIDSIRRPRRAPAKRDVLARAESCHDPGHRTRGEATRILRRTSVSRPSVCDDDVPAVADALLRSQLRGDAAVAPGGGSEEWYRPLQAGLRVATLTMRGSAEAAPHT